MLHWRSLVMLIHCNSRRLARVALSYVDKPPRGRLMQVGRRDSCISMHDHAMLCSCCHRTWRQRWVIISPFCRSRCSRAYLARQHFTIIRHLWVWVMRWWWWYAENVSAVNRTGLDDSAFDFLQCSLTHAKENQFNQSLGDNHIDEPRP